MKIGEKLYRAIVIVLCVILVITLLPTAKRIYNGASQKRITYGDVKVTKISNGNIESINTIDKTTLKVIYDKADDNYTLYRDDVEYKLSTEQYGDDLLIDLDKTGEPNYDGNVVGQCPLVIPLILWTPALIEAAQITIAATVAVVGTYTVWYTADSIAQTIQSTKVEEKTVAKDVAKEDTKKSTGYFEAALIRGKVAISRQITYPEAVARLAAGLDVFATSKMAASSAAFTATIPPAKLIHHLAHDSGDGFYPHFHPGGVKWKVNPLHEPHCWYGAAPVGK